MASKSKEMGGKATSDVNVVCKLYPSLSFQEILFYNITWIFGVFYVCHSFYIASQEKSGSLKNVHTVKPWWNFWSASLMKRDDSDPEWNIWKIITFRARVLVVIYPILSLLCKRFLKNFSLILSVIYSVGVTMHLIGVQPTLFLFMQIGVIWIAYLTNSAKVVWVVAISYLLCLDLFPLKMLYASLFPGKASHHFQEPLTRVFLFCMNLRCVSFSLDRIWHRVQRESLFNGLLMLTAFCFYLPLLLLGPQISSKTFKDSLEKPLQSLDRTFWVNILTQSLRYGIWHILTDVSLYFMYQQAFTYHPEYVNSLNLWALCGMGYFMLVFFQLKYTVMYGVTGFLARIDNVHTPDHPKCIARLHLMSQIMRDFDPGFYLFLKHYIYLPVQASLPASKLNGLIASAACFLFMFVWHGGMVYFVFIWCSLNFFCSICEVVGRAVGRNAIFQKYESYYFSPRGVRRLHAFLASPLLLIGHISGLFFFFGVKIANTFLWRILFESWPFGFPTIIFFLYCCSQISIELRNGQLKRELITKKDKNE